MDSNIKPSGSRSRHHVKLMSGLEMGESIQEKVLKELSTNLASLMVVEN